MRSPELEAAVQRLLAERAEQGLPPQVEDAATIERVAGILRIAREEKRRAQERAK